MKRLLSVFILISTFGLVHAQKLDKKEKDPFTNNLVASTKYETLFSDSKLFLSSSIAFKFSKVNNDTKLSLKVIIDDGKDFEVHTDQAFFLKFDNGDVIELYPNSNVYSSIGKGAVGLRLSGVPGAEIEYNLTDKDVMTILNHNLVSARLNNSYKIVENLEIKKKSAKVFKDSLSLISK